MRGGVLSQVLRVLERWARIHQPARGDSVRHQRSIRVKGEKMRRTRKIQDND